MTVSAGQMLNPLVISRLGNLELIARKVVEGFITGLHRSPYHGFSVEFTDHRPYMPGDELKNIDWKLYAKTERYYIKQFEEETNLKAYLLIDASRSMSFRHHGTLAKDRYAVMLAASLAYLLLRQRDGVGLALYSDRLQRFLPPRARMSQMKVLTSALEALSCDGLTTPLPIYRELAERIHRRGLIVVLSDLLTAPEDTIRSLKYFAHHKHEVIVFHLLDPAELNLPGAGEVLYRDLETGEALQTNSWEIKPAYDRAVERMTTDLRRRCREALIDYQLVSTAAPFDRALFSFLEKRKRLG
ncbi:MAG TPA: DUF58 domain-containing protein [Candidatus Glassbacteria bacterium]|nr:DUF58 domain-containing protein [Candidatus Glassbacteria bacterium]